MPELLAIQVQQRFLRHTTAKTDFLRIAGPFMHVRKSERARARARARARKSESESA